MKIDFNKIKELKVVCVGDLMLDEFISGTVSRVSPEAPVPVIKHGEIRRMLGGVGNVVANLLDLGAKVTLFSTVGEDSEGRTVLGLLQKYDALEAYISVDKETPTTTKTRFVAGKQHLIRYDKEARVSFTPEAEAAIIQSIKEACVDADVLIASDYNKGYLTSAIKESLAEIQGPFKIVDSKGSIAEYAKGFDLITPNIKELEEFTVSKVADGMDNVVTLFNLMYSFPNILVTASERGMTLYSKEGTRKSKKTAKDGSIYYMTEPVWKKCYEPAYNKNPVDVSGAGDTVVASFAIGKALGLSFQDVLEFASHCAAISVNKAGTSTVSVEELEKRYNQDYVDFRDLMPVLSRLDYQRGNGRQIGFVNGCFDMLHLGHLTLLKKARENCQYLVVAVNSDYAVKQLKGETRPINDEHSRCELLSSLKFVDEVVIFDELDPREILSKLKPSVVFKGEEYSTKTIIEQETIDSISARVEFLKTNDISTTKIINKIKDNG